MDRVGRRETAREGVIGMKEGGRTGGCHWGRREGRVALGGKEGEWKWRGRENGNGGYGRERERVTGLRKSE